MFRGKSFFLPPSLLGHASINNLGNAKLVQTAQELVLTNQKLPFGLELEKGAPSQAAAACMQVTALTVFFFFHQIPQLLKYIHFSEEPHVQMHHEMLCFMKWKSMVVPKNKA